MAISCGFSWFFWGEGGVFGVFCWDCYVVKQMAQFMAGGRLCGEWK